MLMVVGLIYLYHTLPEYRCFFFIFPQPIRNAGRYASLPMIFQVPVRHDFPPCALSITRAAVPEAEDYLSFKAANAEPDIVHAT